MSRMEEPDRPGFGSTPLTAKTRVDISRRVKRLGGETEEATCPAGSAVIVWGPHEGMEYPYMIEHGVEDKTLVGDTRWEMYDAKEAEL